MYRFIVLLLKKLAEKETNQDIQVYHRLIYYRTSNKIFIGHILIN